MTLARIPAKRGHSHESADWTITGDWTFATDLTVTGDISATTIGGITEANLLDKSATETVAGAWTFSSEIQAANRANGTRSNIYTETVLIGDEASDTITLPNSRDAGFCYIIASTTGDVAEGAGYASFYFTADGTMVDLGTGANWVLGTGSDPGGASHSRVWRSSSGVLTIANDRGGSRYYHVYIMTG